MWPRAVCSKAAGAPRAPCAWALAAWRRVRCWPICNGRGNRWRRCGCALWRGGCFLGGGGRLPGRGFFLGGGRGPRVLLGLGPGGFFGPLASRGGLLVGRGGGGGRGGVG